MANVPTTQTDSVVDQLDRVHQRIAQRAYQLFQSRGGFWTDPFSDWLTAERELVWKPPVELCEKDGQFTLQTALPGIEAKDIAVDITPREVVIRAKTEHAHATGKGEVVCCEFGEQVFRSVTFPKAVEVEKARADYQNGLLNVTVPIAPDAKAKRVHVQAA
jgi:HSP20 family protein